MPQMFMDVYTHLSINAEQFQMRQNQWIAIYFEQSVTSWILNMLYLSSNYAKFSNEVNIFEFRILMTLVILVRLKLFCINV